MESWFRGLQNWKTVQMKGCAFAAEIPGLSRSGQPRPLPTSEIPGHAVAPSGAAGHCSAGWGLQGEWTKCEEGPTYFWAGRKAGFPWRNACWRPLWAFGAQSGEWAPPPKILPPAVLKGRGNWDEVPRSVLVAIPVEGDIGPTWVQRETARQLVGGHRHDRAGLGVGAGSGKALRTSLLRKPNSGSNSQFR